MNTCKECGKERREGRQFCSVVCSNTHKGRIIFKINDEKGIHKTCVTCNKSKCLNAFSFNIRNNFESGKKDQCKRCGANIRETKRRDRTWKDDATLIMLSNSRQRAKNAGMENTLKRSDIQIPDLCPVFNVPLMREDKSTWLYSPSIDRIDNTKGYTPDNIVIVSRRANILKKDATIDELRMMHEFYQKLWRDKN
jgi:hypothetical protein